MSSADVELVRAGFEAFRTEGVEALVKLVAPEFELTTPPSLATEPDTYRGPDGLRRYFDSFYDAMDRVEIEPRAFHDAGDRILVESTLTARGRTTGIETSIDAVMAWEIRDGLARRVVIYPTLADALSPAPDGG